MMALSEIAWGEWISMDQNALERREKLLKLQEELLAVEQDRLAGRSGCTLEELEAHLDRIIAET